MRLTTTHIGYEEKVRELKIMIQEMEEIFRKMGAPITFLKT